MTFAPRRIVTNPASPKHKQQRSGQLGSHIREPEGNASGSDQQILSPLPASSISSKFIRSGAASKTPAGTRQQTQQAAVINGNSPIVLSAKDIQIRASNMEATLVMNSDVIGVLTP